MIKRKIREINMSINSKKILFKNNYLNSISKSNVSTSNLSNINPDKNKKSIESYEDLVNKNNDTSTNPFLLNSPQNKINYNSSITENKSVDRKNNINNNNLLYQKKNCIYMRKKKRKDDNNRYNNINNENSSIILNDYRKRIMKLFLASFRLYYFIFLRKHFFSFIRNITFIIMKKELFYRNNQKISTIKTKKLKINTLNNIQLSKSYENIYLSNKNDYENYGTPLDRKDKSIRLNTLTNKNSEKHNFRYNFSRSNSNDEKFGNSHKIQCSYIYSNSINTKGKVYEYKNIFISSNNKKNKYLNSNIILEKQKQNKCFIKKIKDIVTKDKRIFIRINYIYLIPPKKRRLKSITQNKLKDVNNLLSITQIYSFEYLSNNLTILGKFDNLEEILNYVFTVKEKKLLLNKLKMIKLIKYIEKMIKIIILNKLGMPKNEIKSNSNEVFLLDDKIVINMDNFNNLDYVKDV